MEEDSNEGGVDHPKHISEERVVNDMTVISLEVNDPLITRHGECSVIIICYCQNNSHITVKMLIMNSI